MGLHLYTQVNLPLVRTAGECPVSSTEERLIEQEDDYESIGYYGQPQKARQYRASS